MSDRHLLLIAAFALLTPRAGPAQTVAEWRTRLEQQAVATVRAADAYNGRGNTKVVYDRQIVVGKLSVHVVAGTLSPKDSASIAAGLRAATERLRAKYGEAAVALTEGGRWTAEWGDSRYRRTRNHLQLRRVEDPHNTFDLGAATIESQLEDVVLVYAGERLASSTPSLNAYSGWAALRPREAMFAEVARRLATSWAGTARRCAARAIDACAVVVSPFNGRGEPNIYYDPIDFRNVVATARMPALGDSAYFAARRKCLNGEDTVCTRMITQVDLPDPFNPIVRGTLLTLAIELGGSGAVARAAEKANAPPLEALAYIANTSQDSLLAAWHDRAFEALADERGATGLPLWFASLGWGAVFLFASTRRKFL